MSQVFLATVAVILCHLSVTVVSYKAPAAHANAKTYSGPTDISNPRVANRAAPSMHLARRESCESSVERSFLQNLGGNCYSDYITIRNGTGSEDDQLASLESFCVDCANVFATFVDRECDDYSLAEDVRLWCSVAPGSAGKLCGEYLVHEDTTLTRLLEACSSSSFSCSPQCDTVAREATNELGCCLELFESDVDRILDRCDRYHTDSGCEFDDDDHTCLGIHKRNFLKGLGGDCYVNYATFSHEGASVEVEVAALEEFCSDCGDAFVNFLDNECYDSREADIMRYACSEGTGSNTDICGAFLYRQYWEVYQEVFESCPVYAQECSPECAELQREIVQEFGCCASFFQGDEGAERVWGLCGNEIPESCFDNDSVDNSGKWSTESAGGFTIAIAMLMGLGSVLVV